MKTQTCATQQSAWHSAVEEKKELPSTAKKNKKKAAPAVTRIAKPYTRASPAAQRLPTRTPPTALLLLCILLTLKACCTLHNLETPTAFEREGPPNGENETKRETTLLETPTALEREGPPNGENEIQRLTTPYNAIKRHTTPYHDIQRQTRPRRRVLHARALHTGGRR